ncbi:MAG: T9SS type A sorting domain-containing protein [Ignavibacteriaceae bacterium]|nr:T9SS type A sorting domain-containing protein [Ignavibacteriaceae bacterium]
MKYSTLTVLFLLLFSASFTFTPTLAQKGNGTSTTHKTKLVAGDSYNLNINNWSMPMNRSGVMADVLIPPAILGGGKIGDPITGKIVLYSGGFFMSGMNKDTLWANGMMTSSRINDYLPGTYATGQNDPRAQLYVVSSSDPAFDIGVSDPAKKSWTQWKDAVALGADFYDGDHDGVYNPVDKNGNGKWDPDEDRPDILGDVTTWCVYSDQMPPSLRLFNDVNPQGIEIRQTVFAFNSKATIGNTIFIRYKIVNTGYSADVLDSVYFSIACDPDIGDNGSLDLVGSDTLLNAGFTYHPASESAKWGSTAPCFIVDFLQGPLSYIPGVTFIDNNANGAYDDGIDTPIDTATDVRGRIMGLGKYPGAKNLGLSSFFQYYNGIDPSDKFQLRNYTLGLSNSGGKIDPCTWSQGSVLGGVNCANVDPHFMYSGDPVTQVGWINNSAQDQRQISSTGPFKLVKNDTISIVVAYVVGRGTSGTNSVSVAKTNDVAAQDLFDSNFPSTFMGINDNSISKIDFTLSQNYPNPFNPNTVISYSLPSSSNIKLLVYNTLGQLVKTLESGYKSAGNYSINFNASDLPSGIYFYKLEAGKYTQIKKMMLIK